MYMLYCCLGIIEVFVVYFISFLGNIEKSVISLKLSKLWNYMKFYNLQVVDSYIWLVFVLFLWTFDKTS